jgi:signal transduction histidine kinase
MDLRKFLFGTSVGESPPQNWVDGLRRRFPKIFNLQFRLIVPYFTLTVIIAMIGVFIITRLVTSSVKERFSNQLIEASRVAADAVVRQEKTHLEELRLVAFMDGVSDAIENDDQDYLRDQFAALAINNEIEALTALDSTGLELVSVTLDLKDREVSTYQGSDFSDFPPARKAVQGASDAIGDKYSALLETQQGQFIFTSAPVRNDEDQVVGAILIGTRLSTLLSEMKLQALADIILLDPDGKLLATTFAPMEEDLSLLEVPDPFASTEQSPTFFKEFVLYSRDYSALYSPLLIRHDEAGLMGVVFPSEYIVSTMATSRNSFSIIFALGTLAVIVLGYLLAQHIAQPILRLRRMTRSVAAGDLEQQSDFQRSDEIGDLALAFDVMTLRLRERTEEAAQLYSEAIQRNKDLADINARLQSTQSQLIQSEKLASVGQLTAGIVHDVKNPLAVIKGLAEELYEENESDGYTRDGLATIRDSATKANTIVTDLLKFARQSAPEMDRRDLRETIHSVLRLTEYLTRKANVGIIVDLTKRPVMVRYDAQQIEQVLINMITNAVQAMPDGGSIRISLEETREEVQILIKDTGEGIPGENIGLIFDPFFTTKPEGEGTGLGLSVSYGIIARHGGRIEVESEVGKGTTFTIYLPRSPEPLAGQEFER